ncbi:hypothetical protein BN946_scf184970.g36 [Trametes cinnabarina]|uniref:Uncharacterized protein n=1 Tax=Pycnoporus cinnabarinus TaxID=5643 RepID=A0A060SIX6_PYCCI|nr:hypothetical protein BN946_scf184970.g36 [Trametes cinnabarina]
MTAQVPQLPLSPVLLSPPIVAYESAGVVQAKRKASRRRSAARLSTHMANPVKMFNRIVIHPISWPDEALRWMGIPHRIPIIPLATSAALPPRVMSASLKNAYGSVTDVLDSGKHVPREELSNLVVEAFAAMAEVQNVNIYSRAKAYLVLGDMRVRVEPMHGFSGSGVAPVLAYLDEPFRRAQRVKLLYWRGNNADSNEAHQEEERVDMMDAVLLLAFAQEHRRWSAPPDATGNHTTRVMYSNTLGDTMIVLTAITPAETLVGIQQGYDTLKRIRFTRQAVKIMIEEGGRLAVKAPAPRWPIGPWAWTAHF